MHKLEIKIDWAAFVAGDEGIFERVYESFFDSLYNYGRKYTDDEELIEDAIQDLFVRFWKNRANLTEPLSLRNYLFKAFRNHLTDRLRVSGKYVSEDGIERFHMEVEMSIEHKKIHAEGEAIRNRKLQQAMELLTARQREAIFLRFYEGLSYEEIAEALEINIKGTYKLMARSIDAMRAALGGKADIFFILFQRMER
ncbi:MAG TPA: sigma-70 family RNA polymerase sigma factor [Parapedobacter sp.]|nr:sigma-70 family RNA polymerase sigma factor [Parapedobacter sp.]